MKRTPVGLLVVTLAIAIAAPAAAAPAKANSIAGVLGNLRWGMNERDVKTALRSRIKDKSALSALDSSFVEFSGSPTRWDHTPVAEEYTQGNEEAMLAYKDADGAENYYFFIGGQLWKWVKYYPAAAFGGSDFEKFSGKIEARFGKGFQKDAEVNPGSGNRYKVLEYLDRSTRLRAVDKTKAQGQYALMFESMDTVRSLASLRQNTPRHSAKRTEVASNDDDSRSAPSKASAKQAPERATSTPAQTLAASKKKSVFGEDGQKGDDASSYQAKRQRVQNEARDKQRRSYERGEEQKKSKVLDSLAGVDDDDPLSGMP